MNASNEDFYHDKDIIEPVQKIEDDRGFIQAISDLEMKSASIIFTKKINGEPITITKMIGILFMLQRDRLNIILEKLVLMKALKKRLLNQVRFYLLEI